MFIHITGETIPKLIYKNIKQANQGKYFLYCLGFGFDVSYGFLEKLALDNSGFARRIYEDSDAALQLQVRTDVQNVSVSFDIQQYVKINLIFLTEICNDFLWFYLPLFKDFYSEVAIPILKEININYIGNTVEDVTENNFKLLYDGSEIVVAGKLENEIDTFSLEVRAQAVSTMQLLLVKKVQEFCFIGEILSYVSKLSSEKE